MQIDAKYDYIIVGGGSAGCVLANRLSANAESRVLLLEAGAPPYNPWLHIPIGYFKTMHNPQTDWRYTTEADPGIAGRRLKWPRGKTLGGSSAINGLLYIRGQREDYDHWAALGNRGWSYAEVLPYFKRGEDQQRGADDYHGAGGELTVSDIPARRGVCDAFIESAARAGIPKNPDFNGATQEGVGYFQTNTRGRFRCSAARAFLNPARYRPNLSVITRAHAHRVLFADLQATGVKCRVSKLGEQSFMLKPGGEVILSAGALGSPHLLMLSGIGAGADLQAHGIAPLVDAPGVGKNLQDHLQIRAVYEVCVPTLNDEVANPLRYIGIGLQYLLFGTGPMAMAASQVCSFARTGGQRSRADAAAQVGHSNSHPDGAGDALADGLAMSAASESASGGSADAFGDFGEYVAGGRPDVQFHFQPLSADSPGRLLDDYSGVSLSVCQLRPQSRGRLELRSADADDHIAIYPNYLSAEYDRATVVAALRLTRKIAATPPFADMVARERKPGADCQSDAALLESAMQIAETIYHPVGTCKMGAADDAMAVVDHVCRARGVGGLRVVDASIMPTITSGNTNAPTMMIAEKIADAIINRSP